MDKFLNAMRTSQRHPHFYHFTDIRNLPGIRQHGLLSLAELRNRGIVPPAPGGNQWSHDADTRLNLHRYVHLCLMSEHPMEYRAREDGRVVETKFLGVSPDVLKADGVMFSDDVSNKAGVVVRPLAEIDDYVDNDVVYGRTDWKNPEILARLQAMKKFEILVPDRIVPDLLTGL